MTLDSSIFEMKYSIRYPNLLSVCDEDGNLTIIDVNADYINPKNNYGSYIYSVNTETEILPVFFSDIHDNTIYSLN